MRFSLRPKSNVFGDLFSLASANLVLGMDLLDSVFNGDADAENVSNLLVELEHSSDEITHKIYQAIHTTFVTPFDREDIYYLASNIDNTMDHLETIGNLLYAYDIKGRLAIPSELRQMISILSAQARVVDLAIPKLKDMKDLDSFFVECNRLENEGDQVYRAFLVRLFSGEYSALTVMKLKEIADEMEDACDSFEHSAHVIETILVKE